MSFLSKIVAPVFAAACCLAISAQSLSPTDRTAQFLESARNNPAALMDFLARMPKGGDPHHHLTGAVYAESYIDYAVEDGLCLDRIAATLSPPPCDPAQGKVPAAQALTDFPLRNHVIDTWSIRNFVPAPDDRDVRHHFFATFGKFDPVTNKHWGEMLAEVVHRAAAQHEIYLETMLTPIKAKPRSWGAHSAGTMISPPCVRACSQAAWHRSSPTPARIWTPAKTACAQSWDATPRNPIPVAP